MKNVSLTETLNPNNKSYLSKSQDLSYSVIHDSATPDITNQVSPDPIIQHLQ